MNVARACTPLPNEIIPHSAVCLAHTVGAGLWNAAVLRDARTLTMITEPSGAILQSFITTALTPLVACVTVLN